MQNFITGSRAYGTPHENSDIDLVCLLPRERIVELADLADNPLDNKLGYNGISDREYFSEIVESFNLSLRFGKLNLICTSSIEEFNVWKVVTETLVAKKPVTREYAVDCFIEFRATLAKKRHEKPSPLKELFNTPVAAQISSRGVGK